jgi:hypothetical protein
MAFEELRMEGEGHGFMRPVCGLKCVSPDSNAQKLVGSFKAFEMEFCVTCLHMESMMMLCCWEHGSEGALLTSLP